MPTRDEKRVVVNPRIPEGYKVTYHENRGYDSPDRWYEAHHGSVQLGEFGRCDEAVDACITHSTRSPKAAATSITLKIKRVCVTVHDDQSPDRLSFFIDAGSTFPGSGYHPALDMQCGHGFAVKWIKHHFPDLDEKLIEIVTVEHYKMKFSRGDDK